LATAYHAFTFKSTKQIVCNEPRKIVASET
jgi:hypothetical protein